MIIDWGNILNTDLATKPNYSFNAKHWGAKIMAINWKHLLELWTLRNLEVHGDTPERTESIH
jgi:hypothetical protein